MRGCTCCVPVNCTASARSGCRARCDVPLGPSEASTRNPKGCPIPVLLLATAVAAYGQSAITVSVTGPRPLAKAIEQLEQTLRVPINYEDAPYEHPSDLVDVTSTVARSAPPGAKGLVIIPRGEALTVELPPLFGTDKL